MPKLQISKPSPRKERTGVDRLYKRVGARVVAFYYQYPDGTSETMGSAKLGDRQAIMEAERSAMRKALDIQNGTVVAGSVADMIDRFKTDIAPTHYLDQSKDGLAVRASAYANLTKFFGKMQPMALRTVHGYQYLDARAKAGAPKKANKELSLMSTICHYAVRWGVIESNPFIGMMQNKGDKDVRTISRSQIIQFYFWSLRQTPQFKTFGSAAMFTYLTGYRSAEVRPFHVSGLTTEGVKVVGAKRKKGEAIVTKLREWSIRLKVVVARARQAHNVERLYLFANRFGKPYTRSGWGSAWHDAMFEWIASFDPEVAAELVKKKAWDARYKAAYDKSKTIEKYSSDFKLVKHPSYFALQDIRPAAITSKLEQRSADAYDFAAHANPATTHRNYDRRKIKRASATE